MPSKTLADKQLPVTDEISLHEKGWIFQRIGWVLMYAFLLLALLGVFGEGPLSKKELHTGNINLTYERFGRYEHAMKMKFQSDGQHLGAISVPQDYLKNFRVDKVVPEQSRQLPSKGYINFIFEGTGNSVVTFYLVPVQRKNVEGVFRVNGNSFLIRQTIYP